MKHLKKHSRVIYGFVLSLLLIGCTSNQPHMVSVIEEDGTTSEVTICEAQYGKGSSQGVIHTNYSYFRLCYDPEGNFKRYPQLPQQ